MKFNPAFPDDVNDINDAAAILNTSEFNIFSIAYNKWFGKTAPIKTLERYFIAYMFNAAVPHWTRHFARTIIQLRNTNTLNPNDFVESLSPINQKSICIARTFIILSIVIMLALLLAAHHATQGSSFMYGCFFPPCY